MNSSLTVSQLYELFKNPFSNDGTGKYVNQLTGTITLQNINQLLQQAASSNTFGNRTSSSIEHGFVAGDKIYISEGTQLTYNINIMRISKWKLRNQLI